MRRETAPNIPNKNLLITFLIFAVIVLTFVFLNRSVFESRVSNKFANSKFGQLLKIPLPTAIPMVKPYPPATPSPTPTPKPLTFAQMNALYGPCVYLPVIFYHHIQSRESAVANKQTSLTVYTDVFQKQMQYLKDVGYIPIGMERLSDFFDNGFATPARSILLTFDDAYQDFYTDAYPILQNFGFRATMFTPTGLVGNPGYLTWDEIAAMNGPILFANHTWSHANVAVSTAKMQTEISTADSQLLDHGLNTAKIFAYPYGIDSGQAINFLNSLGYKEAFTTIPGSLLCKKQRLALPRIRIGNAPLSAYGF